MDFVKYYRDNRRATAARSHWNWLVGLDSEVILPALRSATEQHLTFEHLGDRHPGPEDIPILARALGLLHAAAHRLQLHRARLDASFIAPADLTIADFVTSRRAALERVLLDTDGLPVAFYKDANIRNFILTDAGAAVVDFDDLTLAPFGYDLAKLIVSTAMAFGLLGPDVVDEALAVYNAHTSTVADAECSMERFRSYAELHHLLTLPYLHRNGYRFTWPDARPW